MSIEIGQHARSQEGQDLGTIRHLIFDPSTGQVNTVVIERGWLLTEDIEVPLRDVMEVSAAEVQVLLTAEQVESLPRFDIKKYSTVPPEGTHPTPSYPLTGMLWPGVALVIGQYPPFDEAGKPQSGEMDESLRRECANSTVISAGDDVFNLNGEKIGEVYSVALDSVTGKPTSIRVRSGRLFHTDRDFPADKIESVGNGVVYLDLDDAPTVAHR